MRPQVHCPKHSVGYAQEGEERTLCPYLIHSTVSAVYEVV